MSVPRRRRVGARAIALTFAAVTIAVIAVACGALRGFAVGEQSAADAVARDAPRVYRTTRAEYGSILRAAPVIERRLRRDGVRVFVNAPGLEFVPGPRGPSPFPSPEGGPGPGRLVLSWWLGGLHPVHVHEPDAEIIVIPGFKRFDAVAGPVMLGALALIGAVGLTLLVTLAFVNREAMRLMKETTEALQRIAQRDFTPQQIVADDPTPIGALARAYNDASRVVATAIEERRGAETEMQRFIADAGHELRTPLTVMKGFVDILDQGTLDPAIAARLYAGMRAETSRMSATIDKLIALARLGTPELDTPVGTVDVDGVARLVAEHLSELAGEREITVSCRGATKPLAWASETDVYDALYQTTENALKYGAPSDVRIGLESTHAAVRITVTDHGPGMSAEDQRRAFERFHRGDETRGVLGSGLGLAIVKRVIEKMGGAVSLFSERGRGTQVIMTIPRHLGES